jgi:hypothetical protein
MTVACKSVHRMSELHRIPILDVRVAGSVEHAQEFVRAQPGRMLVDGGRHDHLIGSRPLQEALQARSDRLGRADERAGQHAGDLFLLGCRPVAFDVVDRGRELTACAARHVRELLLSGGEQPARRPAGRAGLEAELPL